MKTLRAAFLAPMASILLLLFAIPLAIITTYSWLDRGVYGGVTSVFTAENYTRLFDPLYLVILLRTLWLAGLTTILCLLLGFPLALFISRSGKRKNIYLQLVMLPFWTSFLVRTYAWMFLLRDTGLINTVLMSLGVVHEPLPLLYNQGAVLLGLVYGQLPFVVLPLFATLERLDPSLVEAAADLGARPWPVIRHVILPLSAPGLRAAALLAFIPSLGAFLTPDLLGGGKTVLIGNLVQNQFTTSRDWPFGSAIALLMMLITLALSWRWLRGKEELM